VKQLGQVTFDIWRMLVHYLRHEIIAGERLITFLLISAII